MNPAGLGLLLISLPFEAMADLLTTTVNRNENVTLVDALDKVIEKGVVINGDLVIRVADVDLLFLGLRLILTSISKAEEVSGKSLSNPDKELTPEDTEYIKRLQDRKSVV